MAENLDEMGEEGTEDNTTLLPETAAPSLSLADFLDQGNASLAQDVPQEPASPPQAPIGPWGMEEQGDPQTIYSRHSTEPIPQEEDPSYWIDAGRGFVYGGLGFVESLIDLAGDAGNTAIWLAEKSGLNEEGGFRFGEVDINDGFAPQTWLGHAIGGITQVAAGYALTAATLGIAAPASIAATAAGAGVTAGRYGKFLQYAAFTKTKWGRLRRGLTVGAIADFVAFKEHEDRLSNLIKEWPILGNPITQYLAADKSDNWLEGRLKNSLEGMGIGALAEFALLPILRTQKAVRTKLQQGKFDEAMKLQREAGPDFLKNLIEIRNGEEVIVLHNEEYLRQYLTLLPDMDPSKMAGAMVLFKTAAKMHNFSNLNDYLRQGLRTATLNKSLPGGALGDLDHSVFSNLEHIGDGKKGPLGDGTPYALFEEGSSPGIKQLLDSRNISYTTHQRTHAALPGTTEVATEEIYIVPGFSISQAKQLTNNDLHTHAFVTNHGIHQSVDDGTGKRWKVRPLKDVKVGQEGSYKFVDPDGNEIKYDLKYEDELQDSQLFEGQEGTLGQERTSGEYLETDPDAQRIAGHYNDKGVWVEGTFGDTVDLGDSVRKLSQKKQPENLPDGTTPDDYVNVADVMKIFKGVSLYNIEDTLAFIGNTPPEYLDDVAKFLERRKKRAVNGRMTVRDVMKASLMTVGSMQTTARSWKHTGLVGTPKGLSVSENLAKSMEAGIGRKNKTTKAIVYDEASRLSKGDMQDSYEYYQGIQKAKGTARSDKFVTFLDWVDRDPPKNASWTRGDTTGGARAFKKSWTEGAGKGPAIDMVRPEEYVALWIMSPNGRMALDALEHGELLVPLWEELRHLRAATGTDTFGNTKLLPKILREAPTGKESAAFLKGKTKKLNIAQLQGTIDKFNHHMKTGIIEDGTVKVDWQGQGDWDTDYIAKLFKEVSGIGDAKEGFMKHYLGIGDTPTIDSQQLRFWLTGLMKKQKGVKGSVKEMHRMLYSKVREMFKGKEETLFINRVKAANEALLDRLQKDPTNRNLTAHLLHHWLWDKAMGTPSHSTNQQTAAIFAQQKTVGTVKGAVTFGGDGEAVLNLFTQKFSDRYGRQYEASDFSTIVHEVAHIYRRAMKDPIALRRTERGAFVEGFQRGPDYKDAIDNIEKFIGVKGGKWTRKQEEKFATMFEKWIMEGGEVEGLEQAFGKMKGWMEELYRNVHNSPMKANITPEIKSFFSRVFGREGLPTFLTTQDHTNLLNSFDEAIADGQSLENSLEAVGMNLRLWSNETEAEDVLQGLTKWMSDKGILKKYKNELQKRGEGGVGPRAEGPEDANIQYNTHTKLLAKNLADELGTNHEALTKQLRSDATTADQITEHMVAGKMLLDGYTKSIYQIAQKVAAGEGGDMGAVTLKLLQDKFVDVYSSVLRIQRGTARAVQAGNIAIQGIDPDQMFQIIQNSGGINKIRDFAKDLITGADKKLGKVKFKQLRQQSKNQLFWDMTHEWRINGLLSSLKSLTIDLTSTTLHTLLLPAERMMGGFLMGDRELIKEGASLYYGYAHALKEALRVGWMGGEHGPVWKALKNEKQVIDPMVRTSETVQNAWSKDRINQVFPDAQGMTTGGVLAGFFHYAGFWVRWPSRLRIGSKELFDQVAYRARLRQILMKEAMDKFPEVPFKSINDAEKSISVSLNKARKDNIANYVVENMEAGFDAMGRGVNKDALQYAREVNFSEPLVDGLGAIVSNAKYKLPALGLIAPFVRTPTWLIRGFIGRSFGAAALLPVIGDMVATLNPALKAIRADFLAGGARRAKALGKVNTAAVFYGAAVVLAYEGQSLPGGSRARIIGTGPPDPAQRKIWESGGKIANSVEITDAAGNKSYIGFDRLDPFWMFFGMAADFVQLSSYLTDDQREDVVSFAMLALANRLDGAYMKGSIDAAGAWSEGGGKLEHFLANMVKSFVPRVLSQNPIDDLLAQIPGLGGTNSFDDPYRRERESVLSSWQTLIPWLWDKFGVKYDTITGKPIEQSEAWGENIPYIGGVVGEMSPFLYSESRAENNPTAKIAEMLYGFGPPSPKKSTGGVDLDLRDIETNYEDDDGIRVRNAYQAWQKEIGKLPVEKILNSLTSSPGWDLMDRDTKVMKVKKSLRGLRELAFGTLMAKNSNIRDLILRARLSKYKQKINSAMSDRLAAK